MGLEGEYADAETGFVYLRARYYDPATGQFISRDPLTAMTGAPYAYTNNNPLNGTDPLGLFRVGRLCTPSLSEVAEVAGVAGHREGLESSSNGERPQSRKGGPNRVVHGDLEPIRPAPQGDKPSMAWRASATLGASRLFGSGAKC
ncbi:MAG: RHS repeat-associated core domain-containing protein [Actinomycetota bacterium]